MLWFEYPNIQNQRETSAIRTCVNFPAAASLGNCGNLSHGSLLDAKLRQNSASIQFVNLHLHWMNSSSDEVWDTSPFTGGHLFSCNFPFTRGQVFYCDDHRFYLWWFTNALQCSTIFVDQAISIGSTLTGKTVLYVPSSSLWIHTYMYQYIWPTLMLIVANCPDQ